MKSVLALIIKARVSAFIFLMLLSFPLLAEDEYSTYCTAFDEWTEYIIDKKELGVSSEQVLLQARLYFKRLDSLKGFQHKLSSESLEFISVIDVMVNEIYMSDMASLSNKASVSSFFCLLFYRSINDIHG